MSDSRLDELLVRYEELCADGRDVVPTDLCRDCPELLAEFTQRLASLTSINKLLQPTASTIEDTPVNVTVGREAIPGFEILGEIGRGGMGIVYKARQRGLNRLIALKIILAGSHAGPRERARFQTEAAAIARIQHPHIVQVHTVGSHEENAYLVLEFAEGGSLDRKLTGVPWPAGPAAALVQQLAGAAHAAHECGVVHRDLKPANVLLAADGTPKIADFGLAKCLDSSSVQTRSGAVLGTPCYMAPEQAAGDSRAVGPRTDVYALGVILYELLTGRVPFKGESLLGTLEQVRFQEPIAPRKLHAQVPRDLETICLRALSKRPERRYASAQALADDLGRFARGEMIQARRDHRLSHAWHWLQRGDRMRDAGTFMLVHALIRTFSAALELRRLPASIRSGLFDSDSPWEWWLIWIFGICLALFWTGWRTVERDVVALWAGLVLTVIYLVMRLSSFSLLLEVDDARMHGSFLLWFLFVVQLPICTVALLAYYAERRRTSHAASK